MSIGQCEHTVWYNYIVLLSDVLSLLLLRCVHAAYLCKRHLEVEYQYLSFSRLRPKPHSPLLIFLLACATGSADRKPFAWSGRLISNCLVLKEDNQIVILSPYFLHTSSFTCSHKFQGDTASKLFYHFPSKLVQDSLQS